jgi:hypothetical protein
MFEEMETERGDKDTKVIKEREKSDKGGRYKRNHSSLNFNGHFWPT